MRKDTFATLFVSVNNSNSESIFFFKTKKQEIVEMGGGLDLEWHFG